MSFVITGATGQLGRLVVEQLLDAGVPAAEIVATGRAIEKIKDLADRGVRTRAVNYGDPVALRAVLDRGDRVLLVSLAEPGNREALHGNVIGAARDAGACLIAYTSIINAGTLTIRLA